MDHINIIKVKESFCQHPMDLAKKLMPEYLLINLAQDSLMT